MPCCSECQSRHEEQYLANCDNCDCLFCVWCSVGQNICPTCIQQIAEEEEEEEQEQDLIQTLPQLIEG